MERRLDTGHSARSASGMSENVVSARDIRRWTSADPKETAVEMIGVNKWYGDFHV
jgi:hypothetical protein